MRVKFLLVALILSLSLVSAVELNNFEIQDPTGLTNYSVYFNSSVWIFEYNVTDLGKIQLFNISINSSNSPILYNLNETNSTIEIYDLLGKEAFVFGNGTYQYSQYSTQKNITINSGSNVTIYLDTTIPNVNLYFPLNNSANKTLTQNFSVNITDNYGIKNATIWLFNNTGIYNSTITNFVSGVLKIYLGIPILLIDNVYTWWAEIWDYSGNTFNTGNLTFTADSTTTSGMTIIPGTITTDDYSKEVYINFSELNLDTVKWNWNNTNYTIFDSSLVLFYNFDNRSALGENDTLVKDLSKYGNNGTVYGGTNITWTPNGKYNGAFNFSGGVNYIDLDSNENLLETESNYSFCTWFYTKETDRQGIVSDRRSLNDVNYTFFGLSSTNKVYLECKNDATATKVLSYDTIGLNEWYHICGIFDSSGLRIYINGSLDNSSTGNCVYNKTNAYTVKVGSYYDFSSTYATNGSIDNLMIWNRSLSNNEISMLYKTSLTKYNSTNWGLNVTNLSIRNENLSTTNLNESYDYGLFVNDTAGNSNSTLNTITRVPLLTSTLGNFTTSKGIVRNDFYGSQGYTYGFSSTGKIMTDACSLTLDNNYTITRNAFLDAKLNVLRWDIFVTGNVLSDLSINATLLADEKEIVEWGHNNNVKINLIIQNTPEWLANKTSKWCTLATTNYTCPPSNYTLWGDAVVALIDNVTNDGEYNDSVYIEVWNEPYGGTWLNNLSTDNITKATEYVKLYNATYDAIKARYPNMKVGGPDAYWLNGGNLTTTFISNLTNKWDILHAHEYMYPVGKTGNYGSNFDLNNTIDWLLGICNANSANCSTIYISEWNLITGQQSFSTRHGATIAKGYFDLLNYPANITSGIFDFVTYATSNISCDSNYNYSLYNAYGEVKQIPYNVTKNFATYCPSGSTIYASSSNNSYDKSTTCCKGNSCNLIYINTNQEAFNKTFNLSRMPSTIRDYSTKTSYTASQNFNFGLVNSYNILYLGNGIYGDYNGAYWNKPLNEITESNVNLTTTLKNTDTGSHIIELSNLSNSFIYFGNLSRPVSISLDISSNDISLNITVPSGANITVLNNLNITENYNRVNSPVWVNSKSIVPNLISYHIGNNLSDILSISFYPASNTPCPLSASITPNGTTTSSSLSFLCTGSYLTSVNLTNLKQSSSSNVLNLRYDTGTGSGGGGSFVELNESNQTEDSNLTSNVTSCKISSDKLFFPLPTISAFNLDTCEKAEKFNKFFRLMYKDGVYKIIGIKLWVIIVLIVVIILIKFVRKKWR